jgi:transcriptional regulator GlxA family with amidase domain
LAKVDVGFLRRIRVLSHLLAHPQRLICTGPCEVLALAYLPGGAPAYAAQLVAHEAGLLSTTSGLKIAVSRSFLDLAPAERNRIDTLLVAGGADVERAIQDRPLIAFIREIRPR